MQKMTREEYYELMKRDDVEFVKLEINIPKVTYHLIKDKMYLPVDEDIICNAIREANLLSEYTQKGDDSLIEVHSESANV